ncbi:hypothetical protein [Aneurinibacillus terranovensis]|uniref:hypothetical protein n=1 Tax=Aneurinibacillus terranovensis TaxID=278991 RepID=UPI0003FF2361|nr:hypothetical protein [Aneurinibacillus terranovensis]
MIVSGTSGYFTIYLLLTALLFIFLRQKLQNNRALLILFPGSILLGSLAPFLANFLGGLLTIVIFGVASVLFSVLFIGLQMREKPVHTMEITPDTDVSMASPRHAAQNADLIYPNSMPVREEAAGEPDEISSGQEKDFGQTDNGENGDDEYLLRLEDVFKEDTGDIRDFETERPVAVVEPAVGETLRFEGEEPAEHSETAGLLPVEEMNDFDKFPLSDIPPLDEDNGAEVQWDEPVSGNNEYLLRLEEVMEEEGIDFQKVSMPESTSSEEANQRNLILDTHDFYLEPGGELFQFQPEPEIAIDEPSSSPVQQEENHLASDKKDVAINFVLENSIDNEPVYVMDNEIKNETNIAADTQPTFEFAPDLPALDIDVAEDDEQKEQEQGEQEPFIHFDGEPVENEKLIDAQLEYAHDSPMNIELLTEKDRSQLPAVYVSSLEAINHRDYEGAIFWLKRALAHPVPFSVRVMLSGDYVWSLKNMGMYNRAITELQRLLEWLKTENASITRTSRLKIEVKKHIQFLKILTLLLREKGNPYQPWPLVTEAIRKQASARLLEWMIQNPSSLDES